MLFWIEVVKFDSLFFGVFWCFFKVTFDFKLPYVDNYFLKLWKVIHQNLSWSILFKIEKEFFSKITLYRPYRVAKLLYFFVGHPVPRATLNHFLILLTGAIASRAHSIQIVKKRAKVLGKSLSTWLHLSYFLTFVKPFISEWHGHIVSSCNQLSLFVFSSVLNSEGLSYTMLKLNTFSTKPTFENHSNQRCTFPRCS